MSLFAPAPRVLSRHGVRATLVVAVVMVLLILIPYLLNHSLVGAAPVRAGEIVTLGSFRYAPAAGWQIDRGKSRADRVSVLVKGATTYRVTPLGRQSSPVGAFKAAARRYEATGRGRIVDDPAAMGTVHGLTGLVAPIGGNTVAGTLTVLVGAGQGLGITLTARHTAPLTADIADDVFTMLDSVEVIGS